MKAKEALGKFWYLVWKDNSFKGWLFSIAFIFIIVKFIFFPLMNFATGTELPLAIVESCSMYHKGNMFSDFEPWYERHEEKYSKVEINKEKFSEFPMKDGFTKGDILLITKVDSEKIQLGDIVVFDAGQRNPIIHRIIKISEDSNGNKIFATMGDNNNGQLVFEREIKEEQIVGKARVKIMPYFGWVKLIFFEWQKPQGEQGFCAEN